MLDLCNLYSTVSEEEQLVWKTARDFVDREVLPMIAEHHRQGKFPAELVPRLGELGFLGPTLPEKYGCAEVSNTSYGLIMQELERGDSALRSFASVQGALVMYPIWRYGSEQQRDHWLPRLARGEKIGCFGLTEPDYGSNPAGMLTKAEETADGYVLNGTKRWITNGTIADVAVVWARLDGKVRGFLVEKQTPGFESSEIKGKFSMRASVTSELHLSNCSIPRENILPRAEGLKGPLSCLSQARFGIAWGAVGAALAVYQCALEYAKSRIQFSKPIAGYQLIQEKLVEIASGITHAQLLAFRLAQLKDSEQLTPPVISLAKKNNVRTAIDAAREARAILGANGIVDEYPVIRHLLNLETVLTYEGTEEIHTLILGQHLTGVNAFS